MKKFLNAGGNLQGWKLRDGSAEARRPRGPEPVVPQVHHSEISKLSKRVSEHLKLRRAARVTSPPDGRGRRSRLALGLLPTSRLGLCVAWLGLCFGVGWGGGARSGGRPSLAQPAVEPQ